MTRTANLRLIQHEIQNDSVVSIDVQNFDAWFGNNHILRNIGLSFGKNEINCIIGPSGSGKSTLIRSINRMNDDDTGYTCSGKVIFEGIDVLSKKTNVVRLRTEIGMVFQKPCVFPQSIAGNVLFGVQRHQKLSKHEGMSLVEEKLKAVGLWKEVSHRLADKAGSLSMGQQQRLCIARTLAVHPKIILLDEPTSSLDPVSTRAIEDLMMALKKEYTIIFVTHNIQQAKRISDNLTFMCNGEVIEHGPKEKLLFRPQQKQTQKYLGEEFCDC